MATYEDGRIRKLAAQLARAGIEQRLVDQIMAGGDEVSRTTKPEIKAAWFRGAMERMDELIDQPTRQAVREGCACCLGGKRDAISRSIARQHATIEERVAAANAARFVFGHGVSWTDDGRILVKFAPEGQASYRCVCLPKSELPISDTYCYCCAGHAKHHLQTALGRKLAVQVRSSALSSSGARPCTFLFSLAD